MYCSFHLHCNYVFLVDNTLSTFPTDISRSQRTLAGILNRKLLNLNVSPSSDRWRVARLSIFTPCSSLTHTLLRFSSSNLLKVKLIINANFALRMPSTSRTREERGVSELQHLPTANYLRCFLLYRYRCRVADDSDCAWRNARCAAFVDKTLRRTCSKHYLRWQYQ